MFSSAPAAIRPFIAVAEARRAATTAPSGNIAQRQWQLCGHTTGTTVQQGAATAPPPQQQRKRGPGATQGQAGGAFGTEGAQLTTSQSLERYNAIMSELEQALGTWRQAGCKISTDHYRDHPISNSVSCALLVRLPSRSIAMRQYLHLPRKFSSGCTSCSLVTFACLFLSWLLSWTRAVPLARSLKRNSLHG